MGGSPGEQKQALTNLLFLYIDSVPGIKFHPSLRSDFTLKNMDRKRRELHTIPHSLTSFCRGKRWNIL